VVVAVGAGGFLATTAAFTDSERIAGNTVGTARLTIGKTASAPVAVSDLVPGKNVTTDDVVVFDNAGTVDFGYTVTLDDVTGSSALRSWAPVSLTVGEQTVVGTLADPPVLEVESLAPGAPAVGVDVTVGLSPQADNTVKGQTAGFALVVTATQE